MWHQGEKDSFNIEDVELYHNRFMNMMSSLIKELNLPESIPIIIGELGEFVGDFDGGKCKYFRDINATLKNLSQELANGGFVSAKGLTCKNDGIHFNSKSYRDFYLKAAQKNESFIQ